MKHIPLYISVLLFLLSSCRQEESPIESGKGILSLTSVEVQAETISQITTRAVSPDLAIEILKANDRTLVKSYETGAAEASDKIELDPGEYILKACSPNYETSYTNEEKGKPKYYKEQAFTIQPHRVNNLTLQVPMTNIGVRLVLPETFGGYFPSYTFSATIGNRTVTLQDGEDAYFELPENSADRLQYRLSAINTDNETMEETDIYNKSLTTGTCYEVTYSFATRSLILR